MFLSCVLRKFTELYSGDNLDFVRWFLSKYKSCTKINVCNSLDRDIKLQKWNTQGWELHYDKIFLHCKLRAWSSPKIWVEFLTFWSLRPSNMGYTLGQVEKSEILWSFMNRWRECIFWGRYYNYGPLSTVTSYHAILANPQLCLHTKSRVCPDYVLKGL